MKKLFLLSLASLCLLACSNKKASDKEQAEQLLSDARNYISTNQFDSAREVLDTLHARFPKQVAMRRIAKHLTDSMTYLNNKQNLPEMEAELARQTAALQEAKAVCTMSRDAKYQEQGEWYSKVANNRDGNRTTLDAFMTEDGAPTLRSTIVGKTSGSQKLTLSSGAQEIMAPEGIFFSNETCGHHELLTYTGKVSLDLFEFIRNNDNIQVKQGSVSYKLNENDRKAILQVYALALATDNQRRAEFNLRKAQSQIEDWNNPSQK